MANRIAGAEALQAYREKNLRIFSEKPVKKSKYTSMAKAEELLKKPLGAMEFLPKIKETAGVRVLTLENAISGMPGLLDEIVSKEEKGKDQFGGFVNANFNCGFVVIAGKNAGIVELGIALPMGAVAKYFIVVEKGAKVSILEEISSEGDALCSETVYIMEGAEAAIAKVHGESGGVVSYQQCILEKNAGLVNSNMWIGGTLVMANTCNILNGEGASAKEYSLLAAKGSQHFDLGYTTVHRAAGTESHCAFRSALKDSSRMVFDGMIRIEEGAKQTNALLECHSMILGEKASSNQIPGLEIKTDDVRATHSATVARLDEEELFYLQSRGLTHEGAKKMVVKSFLESVVYMMPESLRGRLEHGLEQALG